MQSQSPDTFIGTNTGLGGVGFAAVERPVFLLIGTLLKLLPVTTNVGLREGHDVGDFNAGHGTGGYAVAGPGELAVKACGLCRGAVAAGEVESGRRNGLVGWCDRACWFG